MAYQKSLAVQSVLMRNPRVAKIVAIIDRLGHMNDVHESLKHFREQPVQPGAYREIDAVAGTFLDTLSLERDEGFPNWLDLKAAAIEEADMFDRLNDCTDEQLDGLLALLTALEFGQEDCSELDTDERSLFNHVARNLGIAMRDRWVPDTDFLTRRTKDQLAEIATDAGASQKGPFGRYGKTELVKLVEHHFAKAAEATEPSEDQQIANAWLPEAMQFPAIDRDAIEAAADAEADSSSEEAA